MYNQCMIYDTIIIGAGASGLMCAASPEFHTAPDGTASPTSSSGAPKRLILEATSRPGQKLLMAGGGHCNFTHAGEMKDFLTAYDTVGSYRGKTGSKAAASFLRSALYRYTNTDFMEWMEGLGVPSVTDENDKVFPRTMESRTVREALLAAVRENGFAIRTDSKVEKISCFTDSDDSLLWNVTATGETFTARALIIAAGGVSYPATGSDGSLFGILERDLGISVTDLTPSLAPIRVRDYPYGDLSGISLSEARVSVQRQGEKTVHREGPILFTHKDFSGPAVLDISRHASDAMALSAASGTTTGATLLLNYLWPMTYEEARELLGDDVVRPQDAGRLSSPEAFGLPRRFLKALIVRSGGSPKQLTKLLTQDAFPIAGTAGFEQAMVTRGGVSLEQIDPRSMQVHSDVLSIGDSPSNLFIIGEALNADGISGGYNLQMCWSTARAAAAAVTATTSAATEANA